MSHNWATVETESGLTHVIAVETVPGGYKILADHTLSIDCFCGPKAEVNKYGAHFVVHTCPTCTAHECVCDDEPN